MTAQRTLEITLWQNLPTIIKQNIIEQSDNGRFYCELTEEQIRNIDVFEARRILSYLGYTVDIRDGLKIYWRLNYGQGF